MPASKTHPKRRIKLRKTNHYKHKQPLAKGLAWDALLSRMGEGK